MSAQVTGLGANNAHVPALNEKQVLIIASDVRLIQLVTSSLKENGRCMSFASVHAMNQSDAKLQADLAIVDLKDLKQPISEVADLLARRVPNAQLVFIEDLPRVDQAIELMQLGACDLLSRKMDQQLFARRIEKVLSTGRREARLRKQLDRMRQLAHDLRESKQVIAEQVDRICNDLVLSYRDLASEVQNAQLLNAYQSEIKTELDLEEVLRLTLKFIVDRVGPTNAAVFLPNHQGGYVVGGYVNYNCDRHTAEMILQHLADVAAPRIGETNQLLHLKSNEAIENWLGDDSAYLADSHVLAVPCCFDGEILATVLLFRDTSEMYPGSANDELDAICGMFAEHLARITRVHHRLHGLFADESEDDYGNDFTDFGDNSF